MRSKVGILEGVIFTPVPCDVVYFEPERVGAGLLLDSLKAGEPTTPVLSSFEQVEMYVKNLIYHNYYYIIIYHNNNKIWHSNYSIL